MYIHYFMKQIIIIIIIIMGIVVWRYTDRTAQRKNQIVHGLENAFNLGCC